MQMARAFVGFYWTLPVPWAGFVNLATNADEAARKSKTIRYQVERVRGWMLNQKDAELIDEFVFIDIRPDRATDALLEVIKRARAKHAERNATLVYVDFSTRKLWRSNEYLRGDWDNPANVDHVWKPGQVERLEPIPLAGAWKSDPIEHFVSWRNTERKKRNLFWTGTVPTLLDLLSLTPASDGRWAAIADQLNAQGKRTVTGRKWSAEAVRKASTRLKARCLADRRDQLQTG
jgi:hypothetical protein